MGTPSVILCLQMAHLTQHPHCFMVAGLSFNQFKSLLIGSDHGNKKSNLSLCFLIDIWGHHKGSSVLQEGGNNIDTYSVYFFFKFNHLVKMSPKKPFYVASAGVK